MNSRQKLIILVGPTASGKTHTAVALSQLFVFEVISADSRYLYKGMDIGTAKPSPDEIALIPHHLIDVTDLDHIWSLAQYKEAALNLVNSINNRGLVPLLVGGTGQYIRAIVEGWDIPPQSPDDQLRRLLQSWGEEIGPENLHAHLARLDPTAAAAIDYRNRRRTIRALEVILQTGRRFSELKRKKGSPFEITMLGIMLPRQQLYQRIDARVEAMISAGFIEEVRNLLEQGYEHSLRSLAAIGYVEILDYIQGRSTFDETIMLIKRRTRVFVRRQANWFKSSDPDIKWFNAGDCMLKEMTAYLQDCGFSLR